MNILKKIKNFFLTVIGIIIAIPIAIVLLIILPFDIIKYRRMPYYKDLKRKYKFFITSHDTVKLYNKIKKEGLDISYESNGESEYFIKDGAILLLGFEDGLFEEIDGEWKYKYSSDDGEEPHYLLYNDIIEDMRKKLKDEHKDLPVKILVFYCDVTDGERFEKLKASPLFACYNTLEDIK